MKLNTLIIALGILFSVQAQEKEREGWFIGMGAGISYFSFETSWQMNGLQYGGSLPNMQFGKMLNARSAILVNLPGTIYRFGGSGRERDRGFEGIIPTYQTWLYKRWWAQLGFGLGMDAPAFYDIKNESERRFLFGPALLAGSGVEVVRKAYFSLDFSARYFWAKTLFGSDESELVVPSMKGHTISVLVSGRFYLHKKNDPNHD